MKYLLFLFLLSGCNEVYREMEFQRCVNLYINNPELQSYLMQVELKGVMEAAGVSNIHELVEQRCTYWIRKGNHF